MLLAHAVPVLVYFLGPLYKMNSIISLLGAAALFNQALSAPAPQKFPGDVSPQDPRFTYYPFDTLLTGPCDLTTGPDGAIWSSNFITNTIGRVDPITGDVSEYQVPSVNLTKLRLGDFLGRAGLSCVIQPGSDGFLNAASGVRNELSIDQDQPNDKSAESLYTTQAQGSYQMKSGTLSRSMTCGEVPKE